MKWDDDIYNTPAYSVTDAARYLRIPLVTLRSWLKGRSYATKNGQQAFEPLIQRPDPTLPQLSFINLVEAHVLRIIRETHQVKLDKVRAALDYMTQELGTNHPLVVKKFQTDGIDLFVDQIVIRTDLDYVTQKRVINSSSGVKELQTNGINLCASEIIKEQADTLVNASRGGQLAMRETLKHLLNRVEWDERDVAVRLFPFLQLDGDEPKILYIDPRISFGKPVIAGKGVPTAAIASLYEAGDEIEDIAYEFDCTPNQVKAAIQFESTSLAA